MRIAWMVVAAWIAATMVGGCAGDLARQWAARAETGLQLQADQYDALAELVEAQGQLVDEQAVAALTRGAKAAVADNAADDAFWTAFNARLAAHVATAQRRGEELRAAKARHEQTAAEIRKCVDGMVKAASAWGTKDELNARLDRIEAIVRLAVEKGAAK